ncbi:hypothetical protein MBLNU230_g2048t1 [Neophaeotheca triangularis]
MKTRSKKPTTSKTKEETPKSTTTNSLRPSVAEPSQLFVLPKDASSEARVASLPNPATSVPNRYFICPEKGTFEFTSIAAPNKGCRSWLLAPERTTKEAITGQDGGSKTESESESDSQGYVLETPQLLVATPIDPMFLLLSTLSPNDTMFLAFSDYMERLTDKAAHLRQMCDDEAARKKLEARFESRLAAVCDTVDAGDEKMYKLSLAKLLEELLRKATAMTEHGLPASMDERFVRQELEVPVLSVKREESGISADADQENADAGAESQTVSAEDSQESKNSATTTTSGSTAATSIASTPASDMPAAATEETIRQLRLRTALTYLLHAYTPSHLRTPLTIRLASPDSPIGFSTLDKHLSAIAGLKKEAQALRSISDNVSRKRSAMEDEEQMEKAEAKKRKKEEEEAKKKSQSRGIKQLGKVDTSGMKKMSAFFGKAPAKKS